MKSKETNKLEPLMRCRKIHRWCRNQSSPSALG